MSTPGLGLTEAALRASRYLKPVYDPDSPVQPSKEQTVVAVAALDRYGYSPLLGAKPSLPPVADEVDWSLVPEEELRPILPPGSERLKPQT